MDILTLLVGLVTGLISGIIASVLFSMLSRCFKPKIVIADKIAKSFDGLTPVYKVKFVNHSRYYAKNVHITAQFIDRQNAHSDNGVIVQTRPLKFVRTDFRFVEPYNPSDKDARYAVRLKFLDDVEKCWTDPNHTALEISVYCENEMNGVGKVFKKVYQRPNVIVEGIYDTGKSTKIIEE